MDTFKQLRDAAAAKRDAAIKSAKIEFSITIEKIAELEGRIKGRRKPRAKAKPKTTLADLIYAQLPDDRTFSVDDVCGLVSNAEPDRKRSRATIITNLNRMARAGAIKRVRLAKAGKPVLYSMPDCDATEARTMIDWAMQVEGWQTMEPVELMVRIVENGFIMESHPNESVRSLDREITKLKVLND